MGLIFCFKSLILRFSQPLAPRETCVDICWLLVSLVSASDELRISLGVGLSLELDGRRCDVCNWLVKNCGLISKSFDLDADRLVKTCFKLARNMIETW